MMVADYLSAAPTGRSINWDNERVVHFKGSRWMSLIERPDRIDLFEATGTGGRRHDSVLIDDGARKKFRALWLKAGRVAVGETA